MLEYEWASLVRVAGETNRVLRSGRAKLCLPEPSMWIMAGRAFHEAFIHAVMHRHIELRLLVQVAAIAKLRLRLGQQELCILGMVNGVALNAVHVVVGVLGAAEIHLLLTAGVASQTTFINFFGTHARKCKNLRFIGRVVHVRRPWTVAGFAALLRWTAAGVSGRSPVGRLLPRGIFGVVTGFAGVRAKVLRRRSGGRLGRSGLVGLLRRRLRR